MGTFEIFVLVMALIVIIAKGYTSRDLAKARERLAETDTDTKRLKGQLKVVQFERAPLAKQLTELEKTLVSQDKQILAMQTQLGKIADENAKMKENIKKRK